MPRQLSHGLNFEWQRAKQNHLWASTTDFFWSLQDGEGAAGRHEQSSFYPQIAAFSWGDLIASAQNIVSVSLFILSASFVLNRNSDSALSAQISVLSSLHVLSYHIGFEILFSSYLLWDWLPQLSWSWHQAKNNRVFKNDHYALVWITWGYEGRL